MSILPLLSVGEKCPKHFLWWREFWYLQVFFSYLGGKCSDSNVCDLRNKCSLYFCTSLLAEVDCDNPFLDLNSNLNKLWAFWLPYISHISLFTTLQIYKSNKQCSWSVQKVLKQLHRTLCCTSEAHLQHKPRQKHMSERTHIPRHACYQFSFSFLKIQNHFLKKLLWIFYYSHLKGFILPKLTQKCIISYLFPTIPGHPPRRFDDYWKCWYPL